MLFTFPIFIVTKLLQFYVGASSGIGQALPSWFTDGITFLFSGGGIGNNFLPVYPHPEMTGIVHSVGIMTIVGFLALAGEILVFIGFAIIIFVLIFRALPWSTQE